MTYGVIGIDDRILEPSAGVADGGSLRPDNDAPSDRGVSRSLRNWALFIVAMAGEALHRSFFCRSRAWRMWRRGTVLAGPNADC